MSLCALFLSIRKWINKQTHSPYRHHVTLQREQNRHTRDLLDASRRSNTSDETFRHDDDDDDDECYIQSLPKSPTTSTLSISKKKQNNNNNEEERNAHVITRAAKNDDENDKENLFSKAEKMLEKAGVSMGPIAMSLQEDGKNIKKKSFDSREAIEEAVKARKSIANLTTEEWKKKYVNKDGTVDLFMEDDFNVASRKAGAGDYDTLINVENVAWQNKAEREVDAPIRNVIPIRNGRSLGVGRSGR